MPIAVIAMIPIIAITLAGDYYIKIASQGRGVTGPAFWIGALLYAASAFGLLIAMRHMSLASVGVWYAIMTVLAMTGLGALAFDERLETREILGIGFAIASLVCMSRFA